jgi:hypothetical protein
MVIQLIAFSLPLLNSGISSYEFDHISLSSGMVSGADGSLLIDVRFCAGTILASLTNEASGGVL